jgi:regulator of protease activity HflC (stomatin/prohibitin superfamily)
MFLLILLLVIAAGTYFFLYALPRTKAYQMGSGKMPVLLGFGEIVFWEPGYTFVFLRKKKFVEFGDSAGDIKTIFGLLGQKAIGPISLKTELMVWKDDGVLTRDAQQIELQVALWWRIADPRLFLSKVSGEVKIGGDFNHMKVQEAATVWFDALTESVARQTVNQMGVAEIISFTATDFLQGEPKQIAGAASQEGFEGLVRRIAPDLAQKAGAYGLQVERVEIQNVKLSPDIQKAIDETRKAFLLPIRSTQEAEAQKITWQKAAEVLGSENVALNELLKNFRGSNFIGTPQFLQNLMGGLDSRTTRAANQQSTERAKLEGDANGTDRGALPGA